MLLAHQRQTNPLLWFSVPIPEHSKGLVAPSGSLGWALLAMSDPPVHVSTFCFVFTTIQFPVSPCCRGQGRLGAVGALSQSRISSVLFPCCVPSQSQEDGASSSHGHSPGDHILLLPGLSQPPREHLGLPHPTEQGWEQHWGAAPGAGNKGTQADPWGGALPLGGPHNPTKPFQPKIPIIPPLVFSFIWYNTVGL